MTATAEAARDIPRTTPELAFTVGTAELTALLALLRTFGPDDWARPTDCPGWTVRDVVGHVLGQFEGAASPRVFLRRHRRGHRRYPELSRLAAMTQQQVDDLGSLPPAELIARLERTGPKGLRAARRIPGPMRRLNATRFFPEDPLPDPTFGYILDVIAARDIWMHRVDLSAATGRPLERGEHEREIVAQVVRDLGHAWTGPPVLLELTGPAGGRWTLGGGTPASTGRADAVTYLRTLSGRDDHPALDVEGSAATGSALAAARVPF